LIEKIEERVTQSSVRSLNQVIYSITARPPIESMGSRPANRKPQPPFVREVPDKDEFQN